MPRIDGIIGRVGATPLGVRLISRLVSPWQRQTYRLTKGRLPLVKGRVLLLTTTGRRSGQARTVPLFYLRDHDAYVVCNVRPDGERVNPWVLNLRAAPQARVQVGGRAFPVLARNADGAEVARYWPDLVRTWPPYATFRARGGAVSVFILTPVA